MTGFLNVYKEAGYTSHDVVAIVRKLTRGKVGHTGTLDPDAKGVLPICIGRATKLADMVMGQDKSYIAEVVLGVVTDTGDMSGQILHKSLVDFNKDAILETVAKFHGQQSQLPPMYSAIKIGGKKLYDLARKGQTVERKPRDIYIKNIYVTDIQMDKNSFTIEVDCSKGTYIRSLCMDIGEQLGCGAAMGSLLRTRSGSFALNSAYKIEEIKSIAADDQLKNIIMDVEHVLPFPRAYVKDEGYALAKNGNPLPLSLIDMPEGDIKRVWLYGANHLIGLFCINENKLRLEVMM